MYLYLIALFALVFLIKFLCIVSPSFKYTFKFISFTIWFIFWALLTTPFFLLRGRSVVNMHYLTPFYRALSPLLGIKWKIQGIEEFDKVGSCVIVCNHQTGLDLLAMAQLNIPRTAAVAKKEIFYAFPFGLCAWLCGVEFINRSDSSQARNHISELGDRLRKTKSKIWIFPEGTRHKGDELLPFKKGAFHIAVQHALPIVPIVISPYKFIDDKKKIFDCGKMIVQVLPPIETDSSNNITELTEKTREIMNEEYKKLSR